MNYWLAKSEPDAYSWQRFEQEGKATWDGVRNFQARNNLKGMKKGDLVLFYHSVKGKEVVGIAKVSKESFPDPTDPTQKWVAVEMVPHKAFKRAVTLQDIKNDERLEKIPLLRQSRLSVMPLQPEEFDAIVQLGLQKK
jgi:predicted RNA-binding protein with PUA-like domain